MTTYLFNLAVILAYATSFLGGSALLALAVVPESKDRNPLWPAVVGAFLMVNFFAMAGSGLALR